MIDNAPKTAMGRAILIENTPRNLSLTLARIRLDDSPAGPGEEPTPYGVCRLTNLMFSLTYAPRDKMYGKDIKTRNNFILKSDLLAPHGVCRLSSRADLQEQKGVVLCWIKRNTNISNDIFKIAIANPFFRIPFQLDYEKYLKKIGTYTIGDDSIEYYAKKGGFKTDWKETEE